MNRHLDLNIINIDIKEMLEKEYIFFDIDWVIVSSITSRSRDEIVWLFKHYKDLDKLFDYSIYRDDVSKLKPDPEAIYKSLKYFWVWAGEAVFIWDSYHDHWATKASWMQFCWVCSWVLDASDWEGIWASYIESTKCLLV